MDWGDVRIFAALARHGTLSGAARALGLNHATVGRPLHVLEQAVGEKLIERRPDGYVLTPAGARALTAASDMETAAAAFARGGSDDRLKGLVRINAPPSLVQAVLAQAAAELAGQHHGLDLDVASDVRAVSLERRETDIALRFGRPQDGDILAKPMVEVGFGFYGAAIWADRLARGDAPVFVGFDELNTHVPEARWLSRHYPTARMAVRTPSQVTQAMAARAGVGLALLPHFIGRTEPKLQLTRLEHEPPRRELWLITRREDRKDVAIATAVTFMTRLFERERKLFV